MEKNQPVNPHDSSPGLKTGKIPGGSWSGAGANVKGSKYSMSKEGKPAKRGTKKAY